MNIKRAYITRNGNVTIDDLRADVYALNPTNIVPHVSKGKWVMYTTQSQFIVLQPGQGCTIHIGVRIIIPIGFIAYIVPSDIFSHLISIENNIMTMSGEIHLDIKNISGNQIHIGKYKPIANFMILPIICVD